jgi:hypothetical protein
MNDPNWLYSTIAQSSAAIVAIIGGFITSTVLSLIVEKRRLKNEILIKESELEGLNQPLPLIYKKRSTETQLVNRINLVESNKIKTAALQAELLSMKTRLQSTNYPWNLGWGLVVLGYLAVFGILFPVLILAYQAFFDWAKTSTVILFWIGIILVFCYVAFLIWSLRKEK